MKKVKASNRTIWLFSVFMLAALAMLILISFGIVGAQYTLLTATGAGIVYFVGGLAVLLEIHFEGKKPNLKKDWIALFGTILGVTSIVFSVLMFTTIELTTIWKTVSGVVFLLMFLVLLKELAFD